MWRNSACHRRAGPGFLALVNKLHTENVIQYFTFSFNLKRDP